MKIVSSDKTKKVVKINKNLGSYLAMLIQFNVDEEQVLQTKTFSSEVNATKWALKILEN